MTDVRSVLDREARRVSAPTAAMEAMFQRGRRRARRTRVLTIGFALTVAAGSIAGVVAAFSAGPSAGHDALAPTGPTGTIAYMQASDAGNASTLFAVSVEGGAPVEIGTESYADYPVWSPNGTRIAYGGGADVNSTALVVANADGSGAHRIVDAIDPEPLSWSPDGTRIAYMGDGNRVTGVYVVGADGSADTLVIDGFWQSVAWSPDGEHLLLTGNPDGTQGAEGFDIYTVRTDGTDLLQLTHGGGYEGFATWSPDGSRILFTSGAEFETYAQDVYVMNADGSNEQRLTSWPGFDSFPVWSADGSWIAFASDRDATPAQQHAIEAHGAFTNISMYVMRADGSNVERLFTAGDDEAFLPSSWRA